MQRGQIRARAGHEPSFWEIFFESIEDRGLGTDTGATAADIARQQSGKRTQLKNNRAGEWLAVMDPREGEKEKGDVEGDDDNFRGAKTLSNTRGDRDRIGPYCPREQIWFIWHSRACFWPGGHSARVWYGKCYLTESCRVQTSIQTWRLPGRRAVSVSFSRSLSFVLSCPLLLQAHGSTQISTYNHLPTPHRPRLLHKPDEPRK